MLYKLGYKINIFHNARSSVLARAYFMQKQVLAFRSLLYFRDIYSDYTLFHGFVSLNSCLRAGHSNKRRGKAKANRNWQFSKRRFLFPTHAQTWQAGKAGQPHLSLQRALNLKEMKSLLVHCICCHLFFLTRSLTSSVSLCVLFRNKNRRVNKFFVPSHLFICSKSECLVVVAAALPGSNGKF